MDKRDRSYLEPYTQDRETSSENRGLAPRGASHGKRHTASLVPPPVPRASAQGGKNASHRDGAPQPVNQKATVAPAPRTLTIAPEENYINEVAAKVANLVYFRREIESVSPNDEMLADLVLRTLRRSDPELSPRTMPKFLHTATIRNPEVFHRLMRLTRFGELGRYMRARGVSIEEMSSHWEITWEDASQILLGVSAGVLQNLGQLVTANAALALAVAVIGVVGTLLGPELLALFFFIGVSAIPAKRVKQVFGAAQSVLTSVYKTLCLLASGAFLAEKQKKVGDLLLNNQMFEAGQILGDLAVDVAFAIMTLRDLASIVRKFAPHFKRFGRAAILKAGFASLALRISFRDLSQVSLEGWDIIRLPDDRLVLRTRGLGIVESDVATVEAAARETDAATMKGRPNAETEVRGLVGRATEGQQGMPSPSRTLSQRAIELKLHVQPQAGGSTRAVQSPAVIAPVAKVESPVNSMSVTNAKAGTNNWAPGGRDTLGLTSTRDQGLDSETQRSLKKLAIEDQAISMNSGLNLRQVLDQLRRWSKIGKIPPEWEDAVEQSRPLRAMIEASSKAKLVRMNVETIPMQYQKSTMGSDHELHLKIDGIWHRLDGILLRDGKSYIGESKFTFFDAWEEAYRVAWFEDHPKMAANKNPYQTMKSFDTPGKGNSMESYHIAFLEKKVLPQFKKYGELAERFGFEGVRVVTNTDLMWQTFRQTAEYMKNVEVFLTEMDLEFEIERAKASAWRLGGGSKSRRRR